MEIGEIKAETDLGVAFDSNQNNPEASDLCKMTIKLTLYIISWQSSAFGLYLKGKVFTNLGGELNPENFLEISTNITS